VTKRSFQDDVAAIPELFRRLVDSPPVKFRDTSGMKGHAGIYAFFEGGNPVHVGRTRNFGGRLRGHVTRSHYSASFAFKRTRVQMERRATYKKEGSRAMLMKDPEFFTAFVSQIALIKGMDVRFVEVEDPVRQYLLEIYATIEFELPLDEFDTH